MDRAQFATAPDPHLPSDIIEDALLRNCAK